MDDGDAALVDQADALAAEIAEHLENRPVGCAESLTAGRVARALAGVEGASDWFRGGLVAYQTEIKRRVLGVRAASVLCEEAVAEMAHGIVGLLGCDVAVATSGVAGDEPVDGVAPGTVCIATLVDGRARTATHHLTGVGGELCDAAAVAALTQLRDHLRPVG